LFPPKGLNRPGTATRWHSSVQRVLTHMQDHLEERQSSEGLASIGALSRFHFNRVFRQLTGIPPACFFTALRLESAKQLLLTTDASVTEICMDVGYSSLGTFVSRFTQMVGLSPNGLRRMASRTEGMDLRDLIPDTRPSVAGTEAIIGRIVDMTEPSGVIFVALYDTLLPHARPLRCLVLNAPGEFAFGGLPHGTYVLVAAALPYKVSRSAFLDRGIALRGASRPIKVDAMRSTSALLLNLRPTTPFDPPILVPLPAMLARAESPDMRR
jgi:AraC family transcriptional regulator